MLYILQYKILIQPQKVHLNYFLSASTTKKNSLPNEVINAKTVKNFETALDKHWEHQDVKFNYNAEIDTQTGSHRSLINQSENSELDIVADQASAHDSS
jgi:hypothetical protein